MSKQRRANKVAVESGDGLARIDITEFHKGRLVLRLENKRCTKVQLARQLRLNRLGAMSSTYLGYMVVFLVLLAVVVDEDAAHAKTGHDRWMFFLFKCQPVNRT